MLTRKIVWPDFLDAKIESEVLNGNRVYFFIYISLIYFIISFIFIFILHILFIATNFWD